MVERDVQRWEARGRDRHGRIYKGREGRGGRSEAIAGCDGARAIVWDGRDKVVEREGGAVSCEVDDYGLGRALCEMTLSGGRCQMTDGLEAATHTALTDETCQWAGSASVGRSRAS